MSFKAKIRFCTFYTIVFRVLKSINLLLCTKAKNERLFSCTKKTLVYSFVEKAASYQTLVGAITTARFTKNENGLVTPVLGRFYFRQ